jgi:hypothetical protein
MFGPYAEEFKAAMVDEVTELEKRKTWRRVKRSSLPRGCNVLKGTWVFKIKRYPSGEVRKFKARYCVRGDMQVEGVDFFDTYAPVAFLDHDTLVVGAHGMSTAVHTTSGL